MQGPHHDAKKLIQRARRPSDAGSARSLTAPDASTNAACDFGSVRDVVVSQSGPRGAAGACVVLVLALVLVLVLVLGSALAAICSLRPPPLGLPGSLQNATNGAAAPEKSRQSTHDTNALRLIVSALHFSFFECASSRELGQSQ